MRAAVLAFGLTAIPWAPPAGAEVEGQIIVQTSPLAGFQYHAGRALFPLMSVGDRLELAREPDNPHDARAILVTWRGAVIGYLPRLENLDLARLMDRGLAVSGRILHLQPGRDHWKRVLLEVLVEHDLNDAGGMGVREPAKR